MQLSPTITFRGVRRSTALEAEVMTRLRKLDTYYRSIIGGHVLIELAKRHRGAGNHFHVRIELTVPGEVLVVKHEASLHATAKDEAAPKVTKAAEADPERQHARVAIHEAFDVARRQLQDYARRQRGMVKVPARQARGRIAQIFPIDEYGYIETEDGHDVYFQKTSVLGDRFARLAVGTAVSFVEEAGNKGPQASSVALVHPRTPHRAPRETRAVQGAARRPR